MFTKRKLIMLATMVLASCSTQNPFDVLPSNKVMVIGSDTQLVWCATEQPGTWIDGYDIVVGSNWADVDKKVTVLKIDDNYEQIGEPVLNNEPLGAHNAPRTITGFFVPQHTKLFISVLCEEGIGQYRPCADGDGFFALSTDGVSEEMLIEGELIEIETASPENEVGTASSVADGLCPQRTPNSPPAY